MTGGAPTDEPGGLAARPGSHGERGALVVLEGIDGSGRSTHVRLLEAALRAAGRGVTRTSRRDSLLAAPAHRAMAGATADPFATALLDAANLAERAELTVVPALRAGLVVVADRYAWTPIARAAARGVELAWLERVFSGLPVPDVVVHLDVDPATALARRAGELDAYEAGLDLGLAADVRDSYLLFGARLAAVFAANADRWGFTRVGADGPVDRVAARVLAAVTSALEARATGAPA